MEKYTSATKSKLERIVENTAMIVNSHNTTDSLKSAYNSIKEDWKSLEGVIENWKQIQFTSSNDFTNIDDYYYEKFTEICKTNMKTIEGICKDTLAEINAEHEKEQKETNNNETDYTKENSHFDWAKLSVISAIIIGLGAWYSEVRYDQGKEEIRRDYDKSEKKLEYIKDSITEENSKLLDSLKNYKIKNSDLEKTIYKIKKTCK